VAALRTFALLMDVSAPVQRGEAMVALRSGKDRVRVLEQAAPHQGAARCFRVTTVEERVRFLADSFRQLDLDGQQRLLNLAGDLVDATSSKTR
jgi:hypothetical protein